jgi:NAD(P)-dependent dehydrogenase (short-subunit alcohol dehydrogenase family)
MSSFDLTRKIAIVTGGAGGIGRATVQLLLERGARVAVADLSDEHTRAVVAELTGNDGRALAVTVDLDDEQSIKAAIGRVVDHFGTIDILHNNAAATSADLAASDADIETMPTHVWDKIFTTNCRGTMMVTREALPHLVRTRGAIVNTVSGLALRGGLTQAAYSASKAAIIQMTRCVAASHSPLGVRCNAVAPGLTLTKVVDAFPAAFRDITESETLRDRLGQPEDIAEVVAFLASDAARHITGELIVADGGYTSHIPGYARFRELADQA